MRAAHPGELAGVKIESLAKQILRDWEAGKHKPGPTYRAILASVHHVQEGPLFDQGIAVPLSRRRLLGAAAAGSLPWLATPRAAPGGNLTVGPEQVLFLRQTAEDQDALDQRFGADRLWRLGLAQLQNVLQLIDTGSYDERVGRELHSIAGAFTASLGWFSYDAGLQNKARIYFAEALSRATITQDDGLAMRTLSNMARQAVDLGKGRDAVQFARSALELARKSAAPPRVRALLSMREAQGHARQGRADLCDIALTDSHTAYGRGPSKRDPDWTEFLNDAEMATLEGMARIDLGQHDDAHSRNRSMGLVRLALAAARHGDIDRACHAAGRALNLIEGGMLSSTRSRLHLDDVRTELDPHRHYGPARDTTERIIAVA